MSNYIKYCNCINPSYSKWNNKIYIKIHFLQNRMIRIIRKEKITDKSIKLRELYNTLIYISYKPSYCKECIDKLCKEINDIINS